MFKMNKLFNYRFYYLLNNTIKGRKFDPNLLKTKVFENNRLFIQRLINTTDKSDKNVRQKKFNEKQLKTDKTNDNTKKSHKNPFGEEDIDVLKALDANQMAFSLTVTEMKRFLLSRKIKPTDGRTCLSMDCPFCQSKQKPLNTMNNSNDSKLFINKKTSNFVCYSCEASGNWMSFVERITNMKSRKLKTNILPEVDSHLFPNETIERQLNEMMENSVTIDNLSEEELNLIRNRFDINCLTKTTLNYFDIRFSKDFKQMIIPYKTCYNENKINALKVIELNEDKESMESNKYIEKLVPNEPKIAVFGLNQHFLNDCSFDELVITDSPLDVMAITQQTNIPSVSISSIGNSKNLRPEVLPFFEKFKKITIWFSNSVQDLDLAKVFSRKLYEKRCYFVDSRDKSREHLTPSEALKRKSKLNKYLDSSQQISHSSITTFSSLRHAILSEIKDPLCAGIQWQRFPELNQLLKGHRAGELTVFTGPTGCGKTTFMSEYSLDLCSQGVRTLWGSFEVKNVRLAKMMLTQFAEKSIAKHLDEFDLWADKLEDLPLYFMTFHGQESIDNVLSAMSHAVYVHDIKHVIVDNIQFMLGCGQNYKFDRYWHQDLVLDRFRKFATKEDCHVSLVMHPRKEEDMNELNNNSIFGGAKATQEADNVMILQNKWLPLYKCQKYIQITKNRWDGDLGRVPLWFDKESLSFSPPNRRSDHLFNANTFDEPMDESNKDMEFVTIKCKSEEEFDDFRLQ